MQINSRLIDTVVEVSAEATQEEAGKGKDGIVLTCCYKGNAVSPNVLFLQAKEYSMVIFLTACACPLQSIVS